MNILNELAAKIGKLEVENTMLKSKIIELDAKLKEGEQVNDDIQGVQPHDTDNRGESE